MNCDDVMAIHAQGLAERIRCAMRTNSMRNDRGCDGSCVVNEDIYKEVMKTIEKQMFSQPISDDCVSREAVIDTVNNTIAKYIPTFIGPFEKIPLELARAIKDVPPVTPTQSWIPVGERLPKEGETVLVCYQTQGGVSQSVCEWFDVPNSGIVWSTLCGQKPIAWQPLPKPYEEKRGD